MIPLKKIKIIANPSSGREQALHKINQLLAYMSRDPWDIQLLFTREKDDASRFAMQEDQEDVIVCIGGDGTLNEVANGIYHKERVVPLAILPTGTVNDFGSFLNLPQDVGGFYQLLKRNQVEAVDLGLANDRVFVNVAAGGFLTEIAYTVSDDQKAKLGRMAYYLEGAKELVGGIVRGDRTWELEVVNRQFHRTYQAQMFIIANSTSVGGFKNLAPTAEVQDGLFDVLILENLDLNEIVEILTQFMTGRHIHHDRMTYLQTDEITLSCKQDIIVDLDGERYQPLPMTFKVIHKGLQVLV